MDKPTYSGSLIDHGVVKNKLFTLVSGTWQGALAGALAFVGVALPMDFFIKLNSLLMSLRPLEIVPAYASAWILYAILGLLTGGGAAFVITGFLILIRRYSPAMGRFLGFLIISLILGRTLLRGFMEFTSSFTESGKPLELNSLAAKALVLAFGVWLAWRQSSVLTRLREFLNFVAVCGACAVGVAILMAALPSSERRQDPTPITTAGPRPPIILISIDTLAASHMSLYGYFRDTTPAINRLATQAVVFDNHHSNSNFTTSGISSILSGVRPWVHRAFQFGGKPRPEVARQGLIPSLHRAQYETLTVATNRYAAPDMHRSGSSVDRQATGRVDESGQQFMQRVPFGEDLRFFPTIESTLQFVEGYSVGRDMENLHYDPETAFSAARQMLLSSRSDETPAFLWVHLFPPHDPYASPAPFLKTFEPRSRALTQAGSIGKRLFSARQDPNFPGVLLGRYDEAIRYVDHHVGSFLDWLKQQGRFDDALIIVTSDHGESFTHGYGLHAGPLLHEELIRVPLLIKLPQQQQGRRVTDILTEHADILPTVLEYLRQPAPAHVEGRSLKPTLDGGAMTPRPVYAMNFEQNGAFLPLQNGAVTMLEGRYKYVRYLGKLKYEFMPKLEDGLFDLSADPGELKNLAPEMPDRAAQMRAAIDAQVSAHSLPLTLKD